jgi:hypothetical protein
VFGFLRCRSRPRNIVSDATLLSEPAVKAVAKATTLALRASTNEEIKMRLLGKSALVLSVVGTMAIGAVTTSDARTRGWVAGAAGFAAGAAIGAAAANANAAYYGPGYSSYGYAPTYGYYDRPATAYTGDPAYRGYGAYGYAPGYDTNYIGPMRERVLEGRDY